MMLFAFAPASVSAIGDAGDGSGQPAGAEAIGGGVPGTDTQPGTDTNQGTDGTGNEDITDTTTAVEGGETPDDPPVTGGSEGTDEGTTEPLAAEPTTTTAPTTAAPTKVPAVKLSSVTAGKSYLTAKWAKTSAATLKKIQIQYCTNKMFKNHVKTTYTAATNTSKKIKKLTNGTYYYVRVRVCMKTNGKTRYSKWSAVKTVKTKGKSPSAKKLSTIYVKVAKGGTKTIKLKKGKGKWSLGGSGVIKFGKKTGKYVKIKPVKAGMETVYCKVGKSTYICMVKVLNNSVGNPRTQFDFALVVGQQEYWQYEMPKGMKLKSTTYDKKKGKVKVSVSGKTVKITVKALKPGRFTVRNVVVQDGKKTNWNVKFAFINGFRGKAKAKKTSANYKKWRTKTISSLVSADMSSWQIVDAIGKLIASGKYSSKGGATGMQLWYGGNGTCVSGAKMMHDFMNDLGIKSKVHFAGKDKGPKDIYGNYMQYNKGHKNIYITMGGKTYEVNPQPGVPWPLGTVAR